MPEKKTIERTKQNKFEGKSPSTQAGEFVREEIEHIRKGKHGARSAKQAIAIGLSKARRAGVSLKPPLKEQVSKKTLKNATSAYKKRQKNEPLSKNRSTASKKALEKEPRSAASPLALSRQAHAAARNRSPSDKSRAAKQAAKTKGAIKRSEAAKIRARNTQ